MKSGKMQFIDTIVLLWATDPVVAGVMLVTSVLVWHFINEDSDEYSGELPILE